MKETTPKLWEDPPVKVERRPSTVTELNSEIKAVLERGLSSVWVEGEITNFSIPASGHWYFTLTDGESVIRAACFKGTNFRIRFRPSDGVLVRCRGRITAYEKRGEYQLLVESLQPVGEGARTVAFEQIKKKLYAEGIFDTELKRPIPRFPRRVGVVSSPNGAAIHDILTVLDRRARSVKIVIIPASVQGEGSAREIADGIRMANAFSATCSDDERIDVLIVGRGGGSAEDLWSFNEEIVARAIRASGIPIISAVGHEIDVTIADLAADLRAATPSAAAELVADAEDEILRFIDRSNADLRRGVLGRLQGFQHRLERASIAAAEAPLNVRLAGARLRLERSGNSLFAANRAKLIRLAGRLGDADKRRSRTGLSARREQIRLRLSALDRRAENAAASRAEGFRRKFAASVAALHAMSPLKVLTRGYSITQKLSGDVVTHSDQVEAGEQLKVRLSDGRLLVEVKEVE